MTLFICKIGDIYESVRQIRRMEYPEYNLGTTRPSQITVINYLPRCSYNLLYMCVASLVRAIIVLSSNRHCWIYFKNNKFKIWIFCLSGVLSWLLGTMLFILKQIHTRATLKSSLLEKKSPKITETYKGTFMYDVTHRGERGLVFLWNNYIKHRA